jgi:AcrR family transcriptional regulator
MGPTNESKRTASSRDRILDATALVLLRDGGDSLTITAVASEAGISKGGLFYHFASKELLVEGLVDRFVASFDAMMAAAGPETGAATRAYLNSAERSGRSATDPLIAILAALTVNPSSLGALRQRYHAWSDRLNSDGVPDYIAATIRFAVDGLWLSDVLDLTPARGVARTDVLTTLQHLLDEAIVRAHAE